MTDFEKTFGDKVSGELIKPDDWNGVNQLLDVEFDNVNGLIGALDQKLSEISARFALIDQSIIDTNARIDQVEIFQDAVKQQFLKVSLSTSTSLFVLGQLGDIRAQVTQLDGSPLPAGQRPWVDFVTVWGTLRAAPEFEARAGTGDQTLSVRTNENGEALIQIRADHAEAFNEDEEEEVRVVLGNRLQATDTDDIANVFLGAVSPEDAKVDTAFKKITEVYESPEGKVLQRYLDTYFVRNPVRTTGIYATRFIQRWRDYRATVMAFVKPDSDPISPDGANAAGSIQVLFRDWISPWITKEYLNPPDTLKDQYKARFRGRFDKRFDRSVESILKEVETLVGQRGVLGKQRALAAAVKAIREVDPATPVDFLSDLISVVEQSIAVERNLAYSQAVTPNLEQGDLKAGSAIGFSAVRGSKEAEKLTERFDKQIDIRVEAGRKQIEQETRKEQVRFREEILAADGDIATAKKRLEKTETDLRAFSAELSKKANQDLLADILEARNS